ncbi:MAG: hypothetical protein ABFR05_00050 [Bacteroidota bacterium]
MKPRIALFGLPPLSSGEIKIWAFANPSGGSAGDEIFQSANNEGGKILDFAHTDVELGCTITIRIMSSGICEYSHEIIYNGADISHVPNFRKETNTTEKDVSKDWDINLWKSWNPQKEHHDGLEDEKKFIMLKIISVAPLWESYYADSNIDYLEKFHKLWIGLNSFASQYSTETGDKNKILALVQSDLRQEFNMKISSLTNQKSADKWRELQRGTGLNMTSEIVRDEINTTCSSFDFLELAKTATGLFSDISKELDGLIFLDKNIGKDVFRDIFSRYHQYMASAEGIVHPFILSEAFANPRAPESIVRIGRLVFHNPYLSSDPGNLFNLGDYFGSDYSADTYLGQSIQKLKDWEIIDPLFFKYLLVLYKFRCAYFHGDLPPNRQNNELAKSAYQSLYEIFPAIL